MAQYQYHTEATIEYMENHWEEFHRHQDVFSRFRTSNPTKKVSEALTKQLTLDKQQERESEPAWNILSAAAKRHHIDEDKTQIESEIAQHLVDKSDFNFVKMHLLNHFTDHIRQLGNLLNVSSEISEKAMMDLKQGYRQSNHHEVTFQILRKKAQMEVFQYRELNANAEKQRTNNHMPLTKVPIQRIMNNPQPEIKTLDGLAECCAMPKGEPHNHIARCLKRFGDFPDYVNHNQYFSCLTDAKSIRYKTVAIPVTSFQRQMEAVHIVRCTASTMWRMHKPPRNVQCFSGWGRVRITTWSRLRDAFRQSWSVFSSWRMLNRVLKGFMQRIRCLQQGRYVSMLVWCLSRRGIDLQWNPCTIEAAVVSHFLAQEPLISSLKARSKVL